MKKHNSAFVRMFILLSLIVFASSSGTSKDNDMSGVKRIDGASIESVQEKSPLKDAGTFSSIAVGPITASPEIMKEYKTRIEDLKKSLITDLKTRKKFKNVLTGKKSSGKTVYVTGEVISIKIVDLETRRKKGGWAGKSHLDVYLKLEDASKGKVIKEIIIATYNNAAGAGWSGGATDQSMPADMGKIISAYLSTVVPVK